VFEAKLPDLQAIADQAIVTARLTHAELQVLAGLLKGLPAKAIAGKRNASVNTVRSQIMAILEKTGFRSQKELIASFGNSSFSPLPRLPRRPRVRQPPPALSPSHFVIQTRDVTLVAT
jgi:DNA-binding CsgD family transcriptional regulator